MNSFTVTDCGYDGTSGDLNPLCCISGTVNGQPVFPLVFFAYLAAANDAGKIRAALTSVLYNWYAGVYRNRLSLWPTPLPLPIFPASQAVAQRTGGPYPVAPVIYSPALIGSWQA
jgi:hypothetical protein